MFSFFNFLKGKRIPQKGDFCNYWCSKIENPSRCRFCSVCCEQNSHGGIDYLVKKGEETVPKRWGEQCSDCKYFVGDDDGMGFECAFWKADAKCKYEIDLEFIEAEEEWQKQCENDSFHT